MKKIFLFVGTHPEATKMIQIFRTLKNLEGGGIDERLVATG